MGLIFGLTFLTFRFPSTKQFCDFQYGCFVKYPSWFTSSSHSLKVNLFPQFTWLGYWNLNHHFISHTILCRDQKLNLWVLVFDKISFPIHFILPFLAGIICSAIYMDISTQITLLNCPHKSQQGQEPMNGCLVFSYKICNKI